MVFSIDTWRKEIKPIRTEKNFEYREDTKSLQNFGRSETIKNLSQIDDYFF